MSAWLTQHRAALASAVRRLFVAPMSSVLSLLVIGIALTLPAFGYVLLDNLRELGSRASGVKQISIFMEPGASRQEADEIASRLRQAGGLAWRFVPREEALQRLRQSEGMAEIVASLPKNPLPDAFIVEPEDSGPAALEALGQELANWPKVAHVQLDS
ncbi:MAG: permease-like cell division protein FtsX, partial [Betaproteobacteria bacterium]|nr:permease-like cell division protein FtsX [Betaproteobacteria bacterium]